MREPSETGLICEKCGTSVSRSLKVCPGCRSLVHSARLKEILGEASDRKDAGQLLESVKLWRESLTLLPENSTQYQQIAARIEAAGREIELPAETTEPGAGTWKPYGSKFSKLGWVGAAGLFVWKFKFFASLLLTKGKVLLAGLTKGGTFWTMFLSFGVYWTAWGWKFALGLVLSIYVHEMGHVWALKRAGFPTSAPTFIPGIGAFVRLKQVPVSARENARVGLTGPIWGTAASYAFYILFSLTGYDSLGAIAQVSAWINLFNLLPIGPLDGGRGFSAMSRGGAGLATFAIGVAWWITAQGLLPILGICGLIQALSSKTQKSNDSRAVLEYILLVLILSPLSSLAVMP